MGARFDLAFKDLMKGHIFPSSPPKVPHTERLAKQYNHGEL
jgi:hypothetical protein